MNFVASVTNVRNLHHFYEETLTSSLGPSSSQIVSKKCVLCRWVRVSACFLWKKDVEMFMPKKKASRLLSAKGPKAKISHGMGPSVPTVWLTCIHVKVPLMQRSVIRILEEHMQPSRQCLLLGSPWLFQQDNARPHSACVTTAWLRRHRVCVLEWPVCSPDHSCIESLWHIMKRSIRQQQPQTVGFNWGLS